MKKIYVADDDLGILDATKLMLELEGYQVETFLDSSIIQKMVTAPPQLLLLDIWMSGEDGKDICRELKGKKATKHIPIIMVSASRDVEDSVREAGANDFISKPFEMSLLISKIKQHSL